jgi:glutamyl-tRNA reductase
MNLILIGINHKTAPIEIREKFFLTPIEQELFLSELKSRPEVAEAFILSTCNRTEAYVHWIGDDNNFRFLIKLILQIKKLPLSPGYDKHFYIYRKEAAVEHFLRVATGLDSLVLGEKQILGQVKESIRRARDMATLAKTFNLLSNVAIRTGKKAQTETAISSGGSSVSWAAITMVERMLGTLRGKSVLIIGAGKMSELALKQIRERGVDPIYLMNRTVANALPLVSKYCGAAVPFSEIKDILGKVDVGVCSAGAPHYILEKETVAAVMQARQGRPLVLVDISMPRNIDPRVMEIEDVTLLHIDDLEKVVDENMRRRRVAAAEVETIVAAKLKEFYAKLEKLQTNTSGEHSLGSGEVPHESCGTKTGCRQPIP